MIACARSGKRTLSDLEEVGARKLVELMAPKFGWFGLKRLFG